MAQAPQLQILHRSNYTKQFLVSLPNACPFPPLKSRSIRIQSRILSLSANTLTYGRLGQAFGWWNVWEVPPSLEAPYNDESKYGHISSWGYAEVIESKHDGVPVGTMLFGYLPIGTYPEALEVDIESETGHVIETGQHRSHLLTIYNRYKPEPDTKNKNELGWSANMQILFETSYLLNRYTFAWDGLQQHPWGSKVPRTKQDADLTNAVVYLLAPSGMTALVFAHQLRHGRPKDRQPRKVIAIGSARTKDFSKATGLFDDVVLYSDSTPDMVEKVGVDKDTKVLLVVFGVREDADYDWYTVLKSATENVKVVLVGGDPKAKGVPKLGALLEDPNSGVVRANASLMRDSSMTAVGKTTYFREMAKAFDEFNEGGTVNGLEFKWVEGLKDGWDDLCAGKIRPSVSLVYDV